MSKTFKRNFVINVFGNVLEWYDFVVFSYLSIVLGKLFFPVSTTAVSTIYVFGIFAISYFVRPVGGTILGYLGDRYGRIKTLKASLLLMAVPSVLIGLLPTYEHVGLLAPIMLLLFRLLQGLSAGAELAGVMTYSYEKNKTKYKAFMGSLITSSSILGVLLGSVVSMLIHSVFSDVEVEAYAWRIPFLLGVVLFFVSYYIRHLADTEKQSEPEQVATIDSRSGFVRTLLAILIVIPMQVSFYILFVWMPVYLKLFFNINLGESLSLNMTVMPLFIILVVFFGWLADRISPVKLLKIGLLCLALFSLPIFKYVILSQDGLVFVGVLLLAIPLALLEGVIPSLLPSMFYRKTRFSLVALSFNVASAFFGGTAMLVCTTVIHWSGNNLFPAIYIIVVSCVGLMASLVIPSLDSKFT